MEALNKVHVTGINMMKDNLCHVKNMFVIFYGSYVVVRKILY